MRSKVLRLQQKAIRDSLLRKIETRLRIFEWARDCTWRWHVLKRRRRRCDSCRRQFLGCVAVVRVGELGAGGRKEERDPSNVKREKGKTNYRRFPSFSLPCPSLLFSLFRRGCFTHTGQPTPLALEALLLIVIPSALRLRRHEGLRIN